MSNSQYHGFRLQALTEAVAWCQMILSLFLLSMALYKITAASNGIDAVGNTVVARDAYASIISTVAIEFLIFMFGFVFGGVLLRGANENAIPNLEAWLVYSFSMVTLILTMTFLNYHPLPFCVTLILFIIPFFGGWIVIKYIKEIENTIYHDNPSQVSKLLAWLAD